MEENFTNLPLNPYKSLQLIVVKCFFQSSCVKKKQNSWNLKFKINNLNKHGWKLLPSPFEPL